MLVLKFFQAPFQSSSNDEPRCDQQKLGLLSGQASNSATPINIPKDFNPSVLLTSVETNQNFFNKTFLTKSNSLVNEEKKCKLNAKQIIANKRIQEMQVLGCLIVELFLFSKIRVVDVSDLEKRLEACLYFLNHDNLPRCLRSAVSLLLRPFKDVQNYSFITSSGLPPPSAHQLLQPLLSSFIFPFPKLFPALYSSVSNLILCSKAIDKHKFENTQGYQVWETLNVIKVKRFYSDLEKIWDDSLSSKNNYAIDLIFPFIKELFNNPNTSKLSIILFLNKLCRNLGPKKTNELLLETLVNLYNSSSCDNAENLYLYHKKFLLILIVRCGLKVFLENFISPIVEVLGKCNNFSEEEKWDNKAYNEKYVNFYLKCQIYLYIKIIKTDLHINCRQDVETDLELKSTTFEDLSLKLGNKQKDKLKPNPEVGVFSFDHDVSPSTTTDDEILSQAVEHLELNLTSSDGDQPCIEEGNHLTSNLSHVQSPEITIPGM